MENDIAYDQRVKSCFRQAYDFLDKHKHPRDDNSWAKIVSDLNQFDGNKDVLLKGLLMAVMQELEKSYMERSKVI